MTTPEPDPTPLPAPAPSGTRRRSRVTIAIATVGVVLAGTFGIIALANSGGSKDPDDAVRDLFSAIDQEDAIGVLGSLDPGERDTLQPAVEDMVTELQRVDVLSDGSTSASGGGSGSSGGDGPKVDLDDVSGVDLSVEDLQLHTTQLGDDVSSVEVTGGTVSINALVDELPLGPLVREVIAEQDVRNETDTTSADLDGLRLVTVRDDDGWHVSLLYTLGELLRHEIDPQPPIPRYGHGTPATGASSPEEAVRQGVAAATALDVEKLISLTPADGLEALHDYGPTFAAAVADNESGVEVSGLQLKTTDGEDGTKVVTPTAYTMTWDEGDGGTTTWVHEGDCTTVTFEYPEGGYFPDEPPEPEKMCGKGDPFGSPTSILGLPVVGDADGPGIITEQHDGAWFISPTATLVDNLVGALKATTLEDARRTVWSFSGRYWLAYPDDMWETCGVARPGVDVPYEAGEDAVNRCFEQLPEDYDFGTMGVFPFARTIGGGMEGYSDATWEGDLTEEQSGEIDRCLAAAVSDEEADACFDDYLPRDPDRSSGAHAATTTTIVAPARPTVPPTAIPPTTARSAAATEPAPTTSTSPTTVPASTTTAAP